MEAPSSGRNPSCSTEPTCSSEMRQHLSARLDRWALRPDRFCPRISTDQVSLPAAPRKRLSAFLPPARIRFITSTLTLELPQILPGLLSRTRRPRLSLNFAAQGPTMAGPVCLSQELLLQPVGWTASATV